MCILGLCLNCTIFTSTLSLHNNIVKIALLSLILEKAGCLWRMLLPHAMTETYHLLVGGRKLLIYFFFLSFFF